MYYIVAPLREENGQLIVVDGAVAVRYLPDAVPQQKAHTRDLYGSWEIDSPPTVSPLGEITRSRRPDAVYVYVRPNLFRLSDEYLEYVKTP